MQKRKTAEEYYIDLAKLVSERSSCLKNKVGAVLVDKENRVLSTGYNGASRGIKNCVDTGYCARANEDHGKCYDNCPAVHAEANAIASAAYIGTSIKDSILYVSQWPCYHCTKMLINAGVKEVHCPKIQDERVTNILQQTGVTVIEY